jgi:hypothetical protein
MRPAILTLGGEMQKILDAFSLLIAKTTPHDIAAGRAGGTAITSKLRLLSTNVAASTLSLINIGTSKMKPINATIAMMPTNFILSE